MLIFAVKMRCNNFCYDPAKCLVYANFMILSKKMITEVCGMLWNKGEQKRLKGPLWTLFAPIY